MNPDIFAEWFRRQGHSVIKTESSYWTNFGPRVYQAFPYHWQIDPTEHELKALLSEHRVIALRYSTPITAPHGCLSYHVIYESTTYDIDDLSKKARYDVRKGLEYATYEQISLKQLATEGWRIRKDTLVRQGRPHAEEQDWWEKLCYSAEDLPGFEAWGVFHNKQIIAALLGFTCDDCFYLLYQQSSTDHLRHGINNALAYVVTYNALNQPGIARVFYGLHSLDAPESVDKFKFRMNYEASPVRQRVVFHPWLTPFFNPASHRILKTITNWRPANLTFAKTEGMIRFYLEGKRPLSEQFVPEALADKQLT